VNTCPGCAVAMVLSDGGWECPVCGNWEGAFNQTPVGSPLRRVKNREERKVPAHVWFQQTINKLRPSKKSLLEL